MKPTSASNFRILNSQFSLLFHVLSREKHLKFDLVHTPQEIISRTPFMPPITTNAKREIIEDFARAIREKKTLGAKPAMTVINFRNEKQDGIERPIERVPLDLLRYRK